MARRSHVWVPSENRDYPAASLPQPDDPPVPPKELVKAAARLYCRQEKLCVGDFRDPRLKPLGKSGSLPLLPARKLPSVLLLHR